MNDSNKNKTISAKMAGRLHILSSRYKAKAGPLLDLMKSRGENSFENVMAKSDHVNNTKGEDRHYYRAVTTAFSAETPVDANEISIKVCEIRSRQGLKRFSGNIQKQCVDELKKVFLIERGSKPTVSGRNMRTYTPKFPLLEE